MAAGRRTSALLEASTINFTATGVEFLPPLHLLCTCSNATIKLFKKVRSSDLSTMFDEASLSTLHIHTRKPLTSNKKSSGGMSGQLTANSFCRQSAQSSNLSHRSVNHANNQHGCHYNSIEVENCNIANRDSGSGNFAKDRWQL